MRSLYLFFCMSLWSSQSCWLLGAPQADAVVNARLPIHFEPNRGQVKGRTEWMAQARGASVYITASEVVFALGDDNAHMKFVGAQAAKGAGIDPVGGYSNYFLGKTETSWFTGIPHYGSVRYANVYPGIDILYHSIDGKVEYDFVLAPGANPDQIELAFDRDIRIGGDGDLILAGLRQHRPRVTQDGREVASQYQLTGPHRARIKLGHYGHARPLTIDPVLVFSTYLGGPGVDSFTGLTFDTTGNLYLYGFSATPASPTLDPFQQPNLNITQPVIMKMTPDASRVLFFTVFTSGYGGVNSLALDHSGNIVISGGTESSNFPLKNPIDDTFKAQGGTGFVAKLTPDSRTFIFSTYLGGSGYSDSEGRIQIDADDSFFVFGNSQSPDFPVKNAFQSRLGGIGDETISKFSPKGELIFATYFGSPGWDIGTGLLAQDGTLILTGTTSSTEFPLVNPIQSASNPGPFWTSYLAKMSHDGQTLLYSTYIGGENFSGDELSLALDGDQNIYIFGRAFNSFFTLKDAFQTIWTNDFQGFLMKFDSSGRNLIFSSFTPAYGGVAVNQAQEVYLAGFTLSPDYFPVKNPFPPELSKGSGYLMKLSSSGKTVIFSTLLVSGGGVTLDSSGALYLTSIVTSGNLPVKNAYQPKPGGNYDVYLMKLIDDSSEVATTFETSPASVIFQYVQGASLPAVQTLAVTGKDQYFLTTNAAWLTAVPTGSPTPPNNIQATVNPASLGPGTYTAAITIHPQSTSPVTTVDVTLIVLGSPAVISSVDPRSYLSVPMTP